MKHDGGQDERTALHRGTAEVVADAFGETANPHDYVARPASEDALGRLERIVFDLREPAVLIAPPGMGKSLLLAVFAQRVAHRALPVALAYGALGFEDLCEWILGIAREPVYGIPSLDLLEVLRLRRLLLTVDDASSLRPDTARALGDFALRAPNLGVVLATSPGDPASERMLEAFGRPLHRLHLGTPMNAGEALEYMSRRLERWGAPQDWIEHRVPAAIADVLRLSEGNPRRLHHVAPQILAELAREGRRPLLPGRRPAIDDIDLAPAFARIDALDAPVRAARRAATRRRTILTRGHITASTGAPDRATRRVFGP